MEIHNTNKKNDSTLKHLVGKVICCQKTSDKLSDLRVSLFEVLSTSSPRSTYKVFITETKTRVTSLYLRGEKHAEENLSSIRICLETN